MKVHELKCHSDPFQSVYAGVKSFEIRVNDRDYQIGDSSINYRKIFHNLFL